MSDVSTFRYRVVDVFTDRSFEGNPLAVFPDAAGIDDETMQKIAKELNLSETTFVMPATRGDCAVSMRIFTPARELLFAGHPTIGTAFVLLQEGRVRARNQCIVLEEKVGPVTVRVDDGPNPLIWLRTPGIEAGPTYDRQLCANALGLHSTDLLAIAPQHLSAGNPTIFIPLKDRDAVDRAWLDAAGCAMLKNGSSNPFCVFVFTPTAEGAYSRMFAPDYGIAEDPATGSSTGPLAFFMMRHGLVSGAAGTRFISEQGTHMGRRSILHVEIFGENGTQGIDVGGHVAPIASATMTF